MAIGGDRRLERPRPRSSGRLARLTLLPLALLVAACSGGADEVGGDELVVPEECAPADPEPGPVPGEIALEFVNDGPVTLWIGETCSRPFFTILACLDDYSSPIVQPTCNECSQVACMECPSPPGVCEENIEQVDPGERHMATWQTGYYTRGEIEPSAGEPCSCYTLHPAPPSSYRVRISVYTAEPTTGSSADYEVEHDLELPTGGPVEVRVDL